MKRTSSFAITSIIILILSFSKASAHKSTRPILYPYGTIGNNRPCFIWKDIYNQRDKIHNVKYRITIKTNEDKEIRPILFTPNLYYKSFYVFEFPEHLPNDDYTYTIERIVDNKSINSKHFHYLNYPIIEKFIINTDELNESDNLTPQDLIKYLQTDKYNRLINGYNFIFFGTSGIVTFGIGMLFLKVIDLGLISNIITVISFTSSAIGISAAGYYGYKYIDGKRELHRIVELDKGISLNGDINNDNIDIEIELTF